MMRQMGDRGATWERSPEGPKLEPKRSQQMKTREGRNIKTQKVEKFNKS